MNAVAFSESREVYYCHIWKFYELASHYASAVHLSIPPPRWKRDEQSGCAVLSFTLTLRWDGRRQLPPQQCHIFLLRGFLMRAVKNQPSLTKTLPLEWTSKAGHHLFITILKASKKRKKKTLLWTTKEASSAGYGQIYKQCLWFLVFLARWHPPQRSELHSVLRPFNSLAAVQEKEKKKGKISLTVVGRFLYFIFTAVLMKSLNSTSTERPPLAVNKHPNQQTNE